MSDQTTSPGENAEHPEVVNLSHANVETVTAEMVRMHQADAGAIHSDDVEMNIAAAGAVNAESVSARQSLIGGINTDTAQVTGSVVGGVRGSNIDVEGVIGGAAGDVISVQNARVGLAAAREVRGQRIESLVLLAGRVEGEVHTVVDTRGAIIAGAIAGLVAGVMFLIGRGLSGGNED